MTALLCVVAVELSYGQFEEKENKSDTLRTSYLEEVVVSANKNPELRRYVAQQIKIITPATIFNLNAQSTADLLSNTGVVAMQKSQQGGGSPIIRGFEASRVLLVVDGVRMNNLIYRAGHLQNVITLDNNILDRAEVLFGPSSTVYGSDALGGAIVFFTREPKLLQNKSRVSGNAFIRGGTANQERTFHGEINLSGKKIGAVTSFNLSQFGDLRMGERINSSYGKSFGLRSQYVKRADDGQSDVLIDSENPLIQKGSAYGQADLIQKILFKPSTRVDHLLNIQYSTSTEVPRYDRLTDPGSGNTGLKFAEWYYGPQNRLLTSYRLRVNELGKLADQLTLTASYQNVEESRHQRRFGSTTLQHRIENVDVASLTVDFQKKFSWADLRYGIDTQFNGLKSTAYQENVLTDVRSPLDTRYPGGDNRMNFLASYFTHTLKLKNNITLNDGARIGVSTLFAEFTDKTFFPFPFKNVEQKNLIGSTHLGLIYTPDSWKFSINAGTGFRSPNLDDLAKVFESVAGNPNSIGLLIVPNPDLKPEKTLNLDFSVMKFISTHTRIEATTFVTRMVDAIATTPFTLNGNSQVIFNEFPAAVYANQNLNRARLSGVTLQWRTQLNANWDATASWNYTKGVILGKNGEEAPLDHIAPAFGRVGIQYVKNKVRSELFSNFSAWKRLDQYSSSGEDNLQYATPEGVPSWYTINWRFSWETSDWLTVQFGVDNLLDLQYRTFASGINAPGRNLFLTLRTKF